VKDRDGAVGTDALSQAPHHGPHGNQRVLSLRRSIVGNDNRFVGGIESQVLDRVSEKRQREGGSP
jgi:hypothetical protein